MDSYSSVGFNALGSTDTFRPYENYGLSTRPQVGMIACNHTDFNRPWTNTIYRIGVSISEDQLDRSKCLARVAKDEILNPISTEFFALSPSFLPFEYGYSDCPCSIFQASRDSRFLFNRRISYLGDNVCFFSRFTIAFDGSYLIYRCCYEFSRSVHNHRI